MNEHISERLSRLRMEMPQETGIAHLAEIRRELLAPAPPTVRVPRARLRRVVATAVAAALLLVPTAAIASDDAVPGEILYPVKRAVEWPWSLVDADVGPRHRVEELETVIDRNEPIAVIEARLRAAEDAVDDTGDLGPRLERARLRIRNQYGLTDAGGGASDRGRGPGREGALDQPLPEADAPDATADGAGADGAGDGSPAPGTDADTVTSRDQTRHRDRVASGNSGDGGSGRPAP